MANEIERKYLPADAAWRPSGTFDPIVQGYFWAGETARAQIKKDVRDIFTLSLDIKGTTEPFKIVLPQQDGAELYKATDGHDMAREWTLRVRNSGSVGGEFCLKGKSKGISRPEYEYALSEDDTQYLLQLCANTHIVKDRYKLPHEGYTWEVDVYANPVLQEPKVLIEVELPTESATPALPGFVGREVTHERGYTNAYMARQRWLAVAGMR